MMMMKLLSCLFQSEYWFIFREDYTVKHELLKGTTQQIFVVTQEVGVNYSECSSQLPLFVAVLSPRVWQAERNRVVTNTLNYCREELKEKFDGKLEKELTGPTYELLGRIMKAVSNRKLTGSGGFVG